MEVKHEYFSCATCGITYIDGAWNIPQKYQPTEKQKRTIDYINNRLGKNIKALTKHQCWVDIGKYLKRANNVYLYMDASYYC